MGRTEETAQLPQILKVITTSTGGLTISEIQSKLPFSIPSYTLQRRLAKLKENGDIRMEGKRKGAVYFAESPEPIDQQPDSASAITLTDQSTALLTLLQQPVTTRPPVIYHADFLEAYVPNESSYLTPLQKEQLASIGQTPRPYEPAGTHARNIFNRLLIDLSWNSSRLEGNTYSLLDTDRLIQEGEKARGRTATETQMILNHKEAIEFLVESATEIGFNRYTILNLHGILSTNMLPDPAASGRLRNHGVAIHGSVYTPPANPHQINEWFDLLLGKAEQINDPFEQAFFAMVHIPYLQPFDDVNKRVSRLAANIPLIRRNLSPLSFVDVPVELYISGLLAVYEQNDVALLKDVFMWAYNRSAARYAMIRQTVGEPDPFRLKYRQEIRDTVSTIIKDLLDRGPAADFIRKSASTLPEADRTLFINTVETELLALHEGNFARYRVTPSAFHDWYVMWKR